MIERAIFKDDEGGPRYIFFSGKGGVGKTTLAAATAVWLAERGYRTLLVSTDVQPSLSDIFQQEIPSRETPVAGVANLKAFSVDPEQSMNRHREKMLETLKVIDPDSIILKQMATDAQMDCGAAQASVFELSYYLSSEEYERTVFDTAPTGMHLEKIIGQVKYAMAMTAQIDRHRRLVQEGGAAESAGRIRALEELKERDERAIQTLRSERTSFILTLTPEAMPLAEVERNVPILEDIYGIPVRGLVINRVVPPEERNGRAFWRERWVMQQRYIQITRDKFPQKEIDEVLLVPEVSGLGLLRKIGERLYGSTRRETSYAVAAYEDRL